MSQTKEAHAAYMRRLYHDRRNEWIASQGGVCAKCHSTDRLEVDHIDPATKSISVGLIWSRRLAVRLAELAKCQVLCYECHKEKTALHKAVPHGGGKTGKHGCTCEPCRLRKNEYLMLLKRERRARGLRD